MSSKQNITALEKALDTNGTPQAVLIENPEDNPAIRSHLEQTVAIGLKVEAAVQSIITQQISISEHIGQLRAFDFLNQFTGMARLKWLKEIKDSKAYKGCKALNAQGELVEITTFEMLCELVGTSRAKVDQDILNLNTFGEQFMESAQKMGLGYRQLRQLRALPEDDRQLVIEGEKVGDDPEALKDLLEELAAKRAKDKEALAEAKATLDAREQVLVTKNKALDALQVELAKLKSLKPDEQVLAKIKKEQEALEKLHKCGLELLGGFGKYLAQARAVLTTDDVALHTADMVTQLTSGLCTQMAENLLAEGIDIDYRILTYPLDMGDLALRGDGVNPDEEGGVA